MRLISELSDFLIFVETNIQLLDRKFAHVKAYFVNIFVIFLPVGTFTGQTPG